MKKLLCSLVALSMMASAAPAWAAGAGAAASTMAKPMPLRSAIQQTASRVERQPAPAAQTNLPRTMPRTGSDKVRHSGGGGTGMVIGLVSTLVGVAATVYMVKQMKKTTDEVKQQ